jgi:hypothetical protein
MKFNNKNNNRTSNGIQLFLPLENPDWEEATPEETDAFFAELKAMLSDGEVVSPC